jgi:hypothetical protein
LGNLSAKISENARRTEINTLLPIITLPAAINNIIGLDHADEMNPQKVFLA